MKVAFVGNMNNIGFTMVRYLRDRGVDVDLLLFDNEPEHFHPSADAYDDAYVTYCRSLTWGNAAKWGAVPDAVIRRDLQPYGLIIGCGFAPAYCLRVGRALDVFVPFGGDLYYSTSFRLTYPNRLAGTWRAVRRQRQAIPQCAVFHMDMTNALYESKWAQYRGGSERWYYGIPNPYTGLYNPDHVARVAGQTRWAADFARIRRECDLLLFSHVRHVWGGSRVYPDLKGTDRLLRGIARFKARQPGTRVGLITFEYGTHVEQSKALVAQLGLQDAVHWFPRTLRKDLMCGILHADVVCAEFEFSWLSSSVVYEAMAMAKPILGFRTDELYRDHYRELYPLMNARSPEEIADRLEEYVADRREHRAMGEAGQRWYRDYVVTPAIDRYVGYINGRAHAG